MDTDQEIGRQVRDTAAYWAGRLDTPDLAQNAVLLKAARYNPAAIDRAYAMLADKRAAYGELATPLRSKVGYFVWALRLQLEEGDRDRQA